MVHDAEPIAAIARVVEDRPSRGSESAAMCCAGASRLAMSAMVCGRRFRTFNVVNDLHHPGLHIGRHFDQFPSPGTGVRAIKRDHGLPQVARSERKTCPRGTTDREFG